MKLGRVHLTAFDQSDADRIRQALLDYERAALAEWPQAVRGYEYRRK